MPGAVSIAGESYVPFEPRTDAQRELRSRLQDALRGLDAAPGEILLARFAGELPRGADVENALFYNLAGRGAFDGATPNGVAFELAPAPPGGGVRYDYELAAAERWPRSVRLGRRLAELDAELPGGPPSLASIWWALRTTPGAITVTGRPREPDAPFAVDLRVAGPVSRVRPELVKALLDGVICALQSEVDETLAGAVAPVIAACLGQPAEQVLAALTHHALSALAARTRLVHAFGRGVKWSPDDDRCIAARIVLDRSPYWRLSGRAWAIG